MRDKKEVMGDNQAINVKTSTIPQEYKVVKRQDWIKDRVKALPGKDQNGLAEAIGVHPPQITDMISGKRIIKAKELPGISNYLEMPVDKIVTLITSKACFLGTDETLGVAIVSLFGHLLDSLPGLEPEIIEKLYHDPFESAMNLYEIAGQIKALQVGWMAEGMSEDEVDIKMNERAKNTIEIIISMTRASIKRQRISAEKSGEFDDREAKNY